ncbi:MAG TPA: multiheme c-type cytochrome [Planctomycetaceae bacterium]|nr:multiheme c-type cytochrome [Planctomycetaceae bacterium]
MPALKGISLTVALALGLAAASGCWSGGSDKTAGNNTGQDQQAERPPKPLLDGWTKPAAAIVFSGEQEGFLEPCGCTALQSGGMGRRHALFQLLGEKGWPLTAFDLGGTVRRSRLQSQIKFQTILAGLGQMGYAAMTLGPDELRLGADYLLSRENFSPDADAAPAFVAANVELFESPDYGPSRYRTVTVGDVKIGVTAILGTSLKDKIFPEGANTDIEISDPLTSLRDVLPSLKADEPNLLVLLSHASLDESRELAAKFPEFDVVASVGGPEDPDGKPERLGDTLLLKVGRKGKYVGVLGFYPDADQRLRFELVNLDNRRFTETEEMRQLLQVYQDELRDRALDLYLELPRGRHPADALFVGAATCGKCHVKAYNKWKTSAHAHATDSLIKGRKDEKNPVSRIHDPECLSCHVTGWQPQEVARYVSGYISEALVADAGHRAALESAFQSSGRDERVSPALFQDLQGQQCENCHGPGSEHVRLETLVKQNRSAVVQDQLLAGRRAMHLSRSHAREHVCLQCHDLDNSPDFDFDKYWDKVSHPWRD